jgi:hypothetical protein
MRPRTTQCSRNWLDSITQRLGTLSQAFLLWGGQEGLRLRLGLRKLNKPLTLSKPLTLPSPHPMGRG